MPVSSWFARFRFGAISALLSLGLVWKPTRACSIIWKWIFFNGKTSIVVNLELTEKFPIQSTLSQWQFFYAYIWFYFIFFPLSKGPKVSIIHGVLYPLFWGVEKSNPNHNVLFTDWVLLRCVLLTFSSHSNSKHWFIWYFIDVLLRRARLMSI